MPRVRLQGDCLRFTCPGCGDEHLVPVAPHPRAWGWNGSLDLPTITPSLNVCSGHFAPHHQPGNECWCGKDYGFSCYQCHSVITDGRIAFCADSSHVLSGQTVDLAEIV